MGEATRAEALAKLAGFGYKIGYPDRWRDYSALDIGRDSYVGNRMRPPEFESRRQLGRLGEPVDQGEWAMPAHVVNAYYHPLLNEIVFPAGILQPPFFYADADDAVNYGGDRRRSSATRSPTASTTAGSRFDADGALRDWWTAEDRGASSSARAEVHRRAVRRLPGRSTTSTSTASSRSARTSPTWAAWPSRSTRCTRSPTRTRPPSAGSPRSSGSSSSYATIWRTNMTDEYARLARSTSTRTRRAVPGQRPALEPPGVRRRVRRARRGARWRAGRGARPDLVIIPRQDPLTDPSPAGPGRGSNPPQRTTGNAG